MIFIKQNDNYRGVNSNLADRKYSLGQVYSFFIIVVGVVMALYHLYTPLFGYTGALFHRSVHLIFAFSIIYMESIAPEKLPGPLRQKWWKIVIALALLILSIITFGYILVNYKEITSRFVYATPLKRIEIVLGICAIVVALEAARRSLGWILTVVGLSALGYMFFGPYLWGIFRHRGYSLDLILETQFLTPNGLLGMAVSASANYVILFVIFGALLQSFGFGDLLMQMAAEVSKRARAGPALLAVISSCLMGMISGVATANVAATGTFTIPLMKRMGYKPEFAGAVEAASSTGGQLMPPVMGVVIFLMMDFTGTPYIKLMQYTLFPAILYFLGIGITVHLKAMKMDLKPLESAEGFGGGDIKKLLRSRGHLIFSVAVLLALLGMGYSATYSVVYAILSLIVLGMLHPATRVSVSALFTSLGNGARSATNVAAACAVAGMIVGIVNLTGLGSKFSNLVIDLAGGNIYMALLLTMAASLVLGMGVPVAAAYIIQIAFTIPALMAIGLDMVVAHLFVIYFCAISFITPPVALASYVAAGIAGSNVLKTAVLGTRLGAVAYIIPFLFVFHPELLLMGEPLNIVLSVVTAIAGVAALAIALEGYLLGHVGVIERVIYLVGALLMLLPGTTTDLIGLLLLTVVFLFHRNKLVKGAVQV